MAGSILAWAVQSGDAGGFDALLKQGFELHQQARFAEAIPILESARKLAPQDYFANLLFGIDLLRTGKATEAVPRLELAARIKPGEEIPEDYLGEAEASLGKNASAAEAYRQAMMRGKNSEQSLDAWAGFALERFRVLGEQLRATQAGTAAAKRLGDTDQQAPTACVAQIPALERKLVMQQMRSNSSSAATPVDTIEKLSRCYAATAGEAARQLQTSQEDMGGVHKLRGDVLLRLKGDGPGAETEYRAALSLHPGDPALLERLAEAQLAAGEADAARVSAQAALAVDPRRREALRTLASIAMNDRDYEQALPWLRQLVQESPGNRGAQVELARTLAQTGADAEAVKLLEPLLAAGYPDEKGALHALLGRALRKLGHEADAAKADAQARRLSDAFQVRQTDGNSDAHQ